MFYYLYKRLIIFKFWKAYLQSVVAALTDHPLKGEVGKYTVAISPFFKYTKSKVWSASVLCPKPNND